jgi:hypothetical protein
MGWESDTNKFKIGDGTNHWANLDYFSDNNSNINPSFGTSIVFEGATADSYETTLQVTDPTADRTITLPNVTGTIITTGNLSDITDIGVFTSTIVMEGSTENDFELTLSAGDPTADRTITFPDATGTVATQEYVDSAVSGAEVVQSALAGSGLTWNAVSEQFDVNTSTIQARVADVSDTEIGYLNGVTSGIQTQLDDKSTASKTETFTNKTLTSPKINEDVAVTATATELNILDGVTSTAAELNILDGVTSTTAELNILDGVTATTAELNYVDGVTSDIQTQLNALAPKADPTFTGTISAASLTLSGDLTVNGTTTNLNSTNLVIEDKNIVLGDTASPTDTTADGGGLTLKGNTDKTFNWIDATDSWTSSEHINLASGKTLKIDGSDVFGTGIATFLGTPSSANLISAITDETGTGALVFGTSPTLTSPILVGPEERLVVSATAATGTVNLDTLTSGIVYYTSSATANWTLNVRGSSGVTLNDSLTTNDSITVVFFVTNGGTPYYQTGFQVDGNSITPKWQNGSAPAAGNANSIDIYSYTIVKTGDAAFTAFGSQTRFA